MKGSAAGLLSDELAAFVESGVAIVAATRDEELRPEIARGWGLRVGDDRESVTLCLGAAEGSQARTNLAANGAVAVTCSRPSTYRTVQLKGTAVDVRAPTAEQLASVRRHLETWIEEVAAVGIEAAGARTFLGDELVAVTIAVRELYDQTPGPNAGARL